MGLLIGTSLVVGFHLPGWWRSMSTTPGTGTGAHPTVQVLEDHLIELIDAERASVGCPALRPDVRLQTVAEQRAETISGDGTLGHVDSDLRDPQARATASGYRGRVVENVAVGLPTAEDVMTRWLDPQIDRALKARLDDCAMVSEGVGFSPQPASSRFGPGVWVLDLGTT
jgi:hypothetical protein